MRKLFATGLVLLLPCSALAQQADTGVVPRLPEADVTQVMKAAVEGFIRPGYDAFRDSAGIMADKMATLCEAPSKENHQAATSAFRDAVTDWANIEVVRTGPIIEEYRFERILFYPDRKSTGLKQVQSVLVEADETATDPSTLAVKSVAMQGFGALEFVLAGTGSEKLAGDKQSFRCRYGAAIAGNIANIAGQVADIWNAPDGLAKIWQEPGPDNPVFRNGGEAITALLGILVHGAEMVRDQRIETFYKGPDKAKFPKQGLFWRSENTWPSIKSNLEGLSALLEVSGLEELLPEKDRPIIAATQEKLKGMIALASEMSADLQRAVTDETEHKKLDQLLADGKAVILMLNDGIGGALGLSSGFSFADGD